VRCDPWSGLKAEPAYDCRSAGACVERCTMMAAIPACSSRCCFVVPEQDCQHGYWSVATDVKISSPIQKPHVERRFLNYKALAQPKGLLLTTICHPRCVLSATSDTTNVCPFWFVWLVSLQPAGAQMCCCAVGSCTESWSSLCMRFLHEVGLPQRLLLRMSPQRWSDDQGTVRKALPCGVTHGVQEFVKVAVLLRQDTSTELAAPSTTS
jgi:hypothetical protein